MSDFAKDINVPTNDCISRRAAVDALGEWHDVAITNRLNNLPSAQQWISCEERLPETSGQYYVSGGGKVWICEFLIISTPIGGRIGGWCNNAANPIVQAWCPLPEPWKGER